MVARELMLVKNNLLAIRMDVAGLTQWGSSWRRERACGRVGFERIVEKCENRNQGKGRLRHAVAHGEDNQVGNPPEVLKSA
jgi:hypothetical protein